MHNLNSAVQQKEPVEQDMGRSFRLDSDDIAFFETNGYLGPFSLLNRDLADSYCEIISEKAKEYRCLDGHFYKRRRHKIADYVHVQIQKVLNKLTFRKRPFGSPTPWYKSAHIIIPEVAKLGLMPQITDRLQSLFGEDILLWGAQIINRQGNSHRWHKDVEHTVWPGITVWLGLRHVGPENTMKVIPGSHRFQFSPQELITQDDILLDDEQFLSAVRQIQPHAQIVKMDLRPGDFFIFAGPTWHASHDTSPNKRTSIIYQYCHPSARVSIPLNYDPKRVKFYPSQPPVLLATGKDDFSLNHLKIPEYD